MPASSILGFSFCRGKERRKRVLVADRSRGSPSFFPRRACNVLTWISREEARVNRGNPGMESRHAIHVTVPLGASLRELFRICIAANRASTNGTEVCSRCWNAISHSSRAINVTVGKERRPGRESSCLAESVTERQVRDAGLITLLQFPRAAKSIPDLSP